MCPDKVPCKKCSGSPPLSYLITMPIVEALQKMFKREGFYSKLQFVDSRAKSQEYRDIQDGDLQKEEASNPPKVTWMVYKDGASAFGSVHFEMWPLILSINELPYSERFKKENIIVPAIWCGPGKPQPNVLLKAILPELKLLKDEGVDFDISGIGMKRVKCQVTCATGDSPARALFLNMTAFNGEYPCQKCYQKGECREGYPGVRVLPYLPDDMKARQKLDFKRDGKIAGRLKHMDAYLGLKGPTLLSTICPDPVRGTAIDAMHLIYGGVMKTLNKFFVDQEFKDLPGSVYQSRIIIDERLLALKLPHFLTRVAKSLADIAFWKTSFWKTYTLYLVLAIFKDIVKEKYFKHLASFIAAVQLLNSEKVSKEDLAVADSLIRAFMSNFESLYGRSPLTLNFHLLLHLPEVVKDLGPLWNTACFPQEGINGLMLRCIHGPRYPEVQVASSLNMTLGLSELINNLPSSEAKLFCERLMKTTNPERMKNARNCKIIGSIKVADIGEDFVALARALPMTITAVETFSAIRKDKCLFTVMATTARDSSAATYFVHDIKQFGLIKTFFKEQCNCEECNCAVYVGLQKYSVTAEIPTLLPDIYVPNIKCYKLIDEYVVIPAESLLDVCVKVPVGSEVYLAERCNRKETE